MTIPILVLFNEANGHEPRITELLFCVFVVALVFDADIFNYFTLHPRRRFNIK